MISIIVPVYKTSEYIKKCIDSILIQSYSDFELILIDDGSDDECGKILDEYALTDSRIIVVHKANEGVSTARNIGLELASGEYITFVDSDDSLNQRFLEEMLLTMEAGSNNALVICPVNNNAFQKDEIKKECYSRNDYMKLCFNCVAQAACGKLYRSSVISREHIRVNADLSIAEDFLFNTQYVDLCDDGDIIVIHASLYHYCIRESSLSHAYRDDYLAGNLVAFTYLKSCMEKWNVKKIDWQLYYDLLYQVYELGFANIIYANENLSFMKRIKTINSILRSEDFQIVLNNTRIRIFFVYRIAYRLHRYEIFYCFEKIRKLIR